MVAVVRVTVEGSETVLSKHADSKHAESTRIRLAHANPSGTYRTRPLSEVRKESESCRKN